MRALATAFRWGSAAQVLQMLVLALPRGSGRRTTATTCWKSQVIDVVELH